MLDQSVEAAREAAATSLLSIFATEADGTIPPTTDICDAHSRFGLSFVTFPQATPVPAICEEYDRVGPIEKTPDIARKYFKFIGAHDQDPLAVIGTAKFYKLPSFDAMFQAKVGGDLLPGVHATFSEVISACFSTVTNLLRGGAVRDIIVGRRPVDLDLDWDIDTGVIVECMKEKFGLKEIEYQADRQYAKFGKRSNETDLDPLEGFNVEPSGGDCGWENSPNSLLYDVTNGVIIDPTGYGIYDVCRAQFRIPPACHSPKQWMNFETTRYRKYAGLRYAKMMVKGFHWADADADLPFLSAALHAQVQAEGAGLRHHSSGEEDVDLIDKYYAKFSPEDASMLLAAHRETLFQMMDALCLEANDVLTVVERETNIHASDRKIKQQQREQWRQEMRAHEQLLRENLQQERREFLERKRERRRKEKIKIGEAVSLEDVETLDLVDQNNVKPKITIGETVPLEGVVDINDID